MNRRRNIRFICQTRPTPNVSRNRHILLTSKRSQYKNRKLLILRHFSPSNHRLDERLIVIKRQHRRECITNQYEVAWEERRLSSAFSISHLDSRLAKRMNTFFLQFHAITSDLVTVLGRRAIAFWRQLTTKLPRYRTWQISPRTQKIRSGHASGDHVVKRGNFQTLIICHSFDYHVTCNYLEKKYLI